MALHYNISAQVVELRAGPGSKATSCLSGMKMQAKCGKGTSWGALSHSKSFYNTIMIVG